MAEEFLRNYPPVRMDVPRPLSGLPEDDTTTRKILFLGESGVGKTTFIKRYCEHMRDYYRCETYEGTFNVFTQFLYYREAAGKRVPTRILDLPPRVTEEHRRGQYPNGVNIVVLCFAVDNLPSFDNVVQFWIPEFRESLPAATPFYLLGLKCDMRLQMEAEGRITVTERMAREAHRQFEFSGEYMECSVEGNPQHARQCMDILLTNAFMYDAPGPLAV